jgi:hypothetical protein
VDVASLDSSGNLNNNAGKIRVGRGVDATGGGVKHARAGGRSASGTASCSVILAELNRLLDQELKRRKGAQPKTSKGNLSRKPAYFWFLNS